MRILKVHWMLIRACPARDLSVSESRPQLISMIQQKRRSIPPEDFVWSQFFIVQARRRRVVGHDGRKRSRCSRSVCWIAGIAANCHNPSRCRRQCTLTTFFAYTKLAPTITSYNESQRSPTANNYKRWNPAMGLAQLPLRIVSAHARVCRISLNNVTANSRFVFEP